MILELLEDTITIKCLPGCEEEAETEAKKYEKKGFFVGIVYLNSEFIYGY